MVNESIQEGVDSVLGAVKGSPERTEARRLWRELLEKLRVRRVDAAILACTDLNPARSAQEPELCLLDATELLAAETVRRWMKIVNVERRGHPG